MKHFEKNKKKTNCFNSIHNQVPYHSYPPLKVWRKKKQPKILWQGFVIIENKTLDHKKKVGKWHQKTI